MRKLIIAEKPSMAKAIKDAIQTEGEKFHSYGEGYFESENYYVTSAFGHLYELQEPGGYRSELKKWDLKTLPFFPQKYEYTVKDSCEERVDLIRRLMDGSDEVIHAGDPDREGQIIVDILLMKLGYSGNVTRLWVQDLEAKTVCAALHSRKPNSEYRLLSLEGRFRQAADWTYGINLTRYATIMTGGGVVLNVGRVIDAIIAIVYEREMEIKNFKPEDFWQLEFPVSEDVRISSKEKHASESGAEEQRNRYNVCQTKVADVSTKRITKRPPKLFSQTKLQNACSKLYGWSAEKTLELSQKLYEEKLTTYPRTDSEYLSDNEKDKVKAAIRALSSVSPHLKYRESKAVFDSSKVGAHSAIIPTSAKPPEDFSERKTDLAKCYGVIFDRFLANFYDEDYIADKTEAVIAVMDGDTALEEIKVSGEVMVEPGWSAVTGAKADRNLPKLTKGEILPGTWEVIKKKTSPPSYYTVETLNNTLENPFKKEFETEDESYKKLREGKSIGTEATRAGTIARAIDRGFIRMDRKVYRMTDKGIYLVETLEKLNIDMTKEKTVVLSVAAAKVGSGQAKISDCLEDVYSEVRKIFESKVENVESFTGDGLVCPECGSRVRLIASKKTGKKYYICTNDSCEDFILSEELAGKKLTHNQIVTLLSGKTTSSIQGFKKKDGGTFAAKVKLVKENGRWGYKFDFDAGGGAKDIGAKCPACGAEVRKIRAKSGKSFYVCSNDECKQLFIPEQIAGKKLSDKDVKTLLNDRKTGEIKGFKSKAGKTFSAPLELYEKEEGGYEVRFVFDEGA